MDIKNTYNDFYKSNPNHRYSKSLFDFINSVVKSKIELKNIKILDIGCGNFSVFEDIQTKNSTIYALDFSEQAISIAPNSDIKYVCASLCNSIEIEEKFDLVFDSHCFNSLKNEDRATALVNIYEKLVNGGLFCSEMMVQPIDHRAVSNLKTIKSSVEIENEIILSGFKIIYFFIVPNHEFTLIENGLFMRCDLLRIVAMK